MSTPSDSSVDVPNGIEATTTVTRLRTELTGLVDTARETHQGVLIQDDDEPQAVLLSWTAYKAITEKLDLGSL